MEFYEVLLLLCKQGEICQNLRGTFLLQHIKSVPALHTQVRKTENNGSFAPIMAWSRFCFTVVGIHVPSALLEGSSLFFLSMFVYTLLYLDTRELSHINENCKCFILG